MGLLKVIEYSPTNKNEIVFKYSLKNDFIGKGSKLTVREGQNVVFSDKGRMLDVFEPGFYNLETANIPMLTKIMSWKYGFESPFKSDIFYVNMTQFTNQPWGTSNPILIKDPEFGMVRIRGFGKYSFRVKDAYIFLKELSGTSSSYTSQEVSDYLRSMLIQDITDALGEIKVPVYDLAANLRELSKTITASVQPSFAKIGLELVNIFIENVSLPEEVQKAIDQNASRGFQRQNIDVELELGKLEALKTAAGNQGSLGGMMGIGLGQSIGRNIGQSMVNPSNISHTPPTDSVVCPKCHKSVPQGKFCSECGSVLSSKKHCPECGIEYSGTPKFCPECGHKL